MRSFDSDRKLCPYCRQSLPAQARICRYCDRELFFSPFDGPNAQAFHDASPKQRRGSRLPTHRLLIRVGLVVVAGAVLWWALLGQSPSESANYQIVLQN